MDKFVSKKRCVSELRECKVDGCPRPKQKGLLVDEERTDYGEKDVSLVSNVSLARRWIQPAHGLNILYYPLFFKHTAADNMLKQLRSELEGYLSASPNVIRLMGKELHIPRRQTAFGNAGLVYSFSGIKMAANPWLPSLVDVKTCIEKAVEEEFNFVLVNEYKNGLDYMGEHRDDESCLCPHASIASLSLGQERDFVFRHKNSRGKAAKCKDIQPIKLSLSHGSLLIMKWPTNSQWYHSLPVRRKALGARINLTFRKMK